ncbi:hypothetical protein RhiXN_09013 [Rhizoctonia solani]|uniref:Uncharacterized protein n=1 Tax=Rhizoctonia solani TaxID=456999 RepID=A0A8H8SX92_9AGAM|nr:uncharacterized protein RhiXN_09011 [Rhizoctonia solani]XP_043180275.1 uncharacterized protein RhiXN_09013 [Rhizoctonia solani]QRW20036.1 hypothetical protein RhiXN_09011 [Rhizoctonia solani]QRW20038.1 hypothetical protein RhiXN_09013 [Rhizoctonia solani]
MTGSATARTTTETFSSVEFVLMLLSMYACVTKEVRTTVMFLLEIVFGYEPLRRRYGREPRLHEVQTLFEPLLELARIHGAEYKREDIQTKEDAMGMVTGILRPILIRLSAAEFAEIHSKADEAVDIMLCASAREIEEMIAEWTCEARANAKLQNWLEWSRTYLYPDQMDMKPVDVPKAGEIAAQYVFGESAAAWTGCGLRRTERVEKLRRGAVEEDMPMDKSGRHGKGPLPTRPCPVEVMVTSPTALDVGQTERAGPVTIRMSLGRFVRSHRGVGRRCGSGDESEERMEREGLEKYKYGGVALDSAEERTTTVDSSDSEWTADSWETSSGLEETWKIQTSQTWPCLDTTTIKGSSLELINECSLVGSQSAPGLTNAAREYSRSELATRGTYGALDGLSGQCDLSRAFSIRSGPWTASMESDTSDWSLQLDWLEHEDDSCVMSRGGSVGKLSDISYESFRFPRVKGGNGLGWEQESRLNSDSCSDSDRTATTAAAAAATLGTSVESLFDGWASDWQSDQLWMWKCAIDEDHAARAQEEAAAEQYAWWASDWERRELDEWRKGMEREVEVRVDRKRRRVEMTGPVEKCAGRLVKKIRYALGF